MSEPAEQQPRTGDGKAVTVPVSETSTSGVSISGVSDTTSEPITASSGAGPSHALLGPFTPREVVFGAGVLVVFLGTLLPFVGGRVLYTTFWSSTSLFFIGIGILLPVVALALLAGRRLGSSGLRVGSLSVDQFASVTAVLAATFFFLQTVTAFHLGALLGLIGSLGLIAATVLGPLLPVVKNDFADRPEVDAHPLARPITAAVPRPPKAAKSSAETTTDVDSNSAAASGSGSAPFSERSSSGAAVTHDTEVRTGGLDSGDARGTGIAGGVVHGSGRSAGSAAVSRGSIPAERSGANLSASSAEVPTRDGSAPSRPLSQGAMKADGGHAGSRAVGMSSDERTAEASAASTSGTGRASDIGPVVDVNPPSDETAIDETRVQEAVRDDSTRTSAPVTSKAASSGGERSRQEPITATRSADEEQVVEAFWFAVGSPRPVFDEHTGREIFVLQPGDWEVGIEDRGSDFLVQDKRSGAVGILRDLRNIERAPRD